MASQLGKRYLCPVCEAMVLCTKAGDGSLFCHEQEMELQQPQKLPSSD